MIEPSRLAAYIASHICHDLISPVGSVVSALDLLEEPGDADMKAQAEQLLQNGADAAKARIQLLRYAFGSAGLSASSADRHEARQIIEDFMAGHKASVDWSMDAEQFSFGHARVLMNLLMMANPAIPRGGVIHLMTSGGGATIDISASAKGPRARLSKTVKAAIEGGEPEDGWSAQTIQPLFAKMVIEELGGTFTATEAEENITFLATGLRTTS